MLNVLTSREPPTFGCKIRGHLRYFCILAHAQRLDQPRNLPLLVVKLDQVSSKLGADVRACLTWLSCSRILMLNQRLKVDLDLGFKFNLKEFCHWSIQL